jgi:SAM-dependent methyltransferase
VTSDYAARARRYAAEISNVPKPETLTGLLRPGLRVAEVPSATGHFLTAYRAARAEVVLIDACPAMLQAARQHAATLGAEPGLVCSPIQDLTPDVGPFDMVVMPNAALNQLAAGTSLAELFAAAARLLRRGGLLLAQVLNPANDSPCSFYDPHLSDGTWHVDRQFADESGQPLTRRRRQHHGGAEVRIDFELHRSGGALYQHDVTLRLLDIAELRAELSTAGFTEATTRPGTGGLVELLALWPTRSPR